MIKIIFKNGNRTLSAGEVISSLTCTRLYLDFTEAVKTYSCLNHGSDCIATVLLDIFPASLDWQIINSCCLEYKQIVLSALSSPKNANAREDAA